MKRSAPQTLPDLALTLSQRGDQVALRFARGDIWTELSYSAVGEAVSEIARGLSALGVEPGDRVAILAATRPEWTLVDLGALAAGSVVVPIYHSDSAGECHYILVHSDSRLVFCENEEQLAKVAEIRAQCPRLDHIVMLEGSGPGAISLDELRERGRQVDPGAPARIAADIGPDDLATIVYTSGTTGPPKGCMTTNGNLIRTARMYEQQVDLGPGKVAFMFLPLAHSLARVTQIVLLDVGATIAYWRGDSAKLLEDLARTRPTHVPAVPRVFEKIHAMALVNAEEQGALRRSVFIRALSTGRRARQLEREGRRGDPLQRLRHALADRLVLSKVRALFGGHLELALTGAAPIAREVLEFFDACGVLVLEGYGLSESTAAATLNTTAARRFGTAGRPLPGCEVSIAPDGEILIRGPNVFGGYFKNDVATQEALGEDGWLATGDLGSLDADGYLQITGRKKDIIITSGGKNISPANIEAALREIRWVSEAVVYGDQRPYLVALLTLDRDDADALAERVGAPAGVAAMAGDERVREELEREVQDINRRFARVEQIKRFAILDRDLTQQDGELTPTLKVKRQAVYAEFRDVLDALYE